MISSCAEFNKIASEEVVEKKKYPPPFSLRLTYEERVQLEAEADGKPLGGWAMILKAKERGDAAQLAHYLLDQRDNDHVELHEVRDFVSDDLIDACGEAMTFCWSKGRNKLYPYYLCDTRGYESNRKSIPRDQIEDGFAEILQSPQPTKDLFALAKLMFKDAWSLRLTESHQHKDQITAQLRETEKQVEALLERIVESDNPIVIRAYEAKIGKLERKRLLLAEKALQTVPAKGRLEEFIEPALNFLANPWCLYENGSLAFKRTVLRLTFSEPLSYSRKKGY